MYFIESPSQGAVKIGFADDVYQRLKSLQTGNPAELNLLATIPCELGAERRVHALLRKKRIRLEWYPSDDAQLFWFMSELQDDLFDAAWSAMGEDADGDANAVAAAIADAKDRQYLSADLIIKRLRESVRLEAAWRGPND